MIMNKLYNNELVQYQNIVYKYDSTTSLYRKLNLIESLKFLFKPDHDKIIVVEDGDRWKLENGSVYKAENGQMLLKVRYSYEW